MTDYRRYRVKGGTYFFTVNLAERKRKLLTEHIDALREAFRTVKQAHPFQMDAVVVLPDHLQTIWTLRPYQLNSKLKFPKNSSGHHA